MSKSVQFTLPEAASAELEALIERHHAQTTCAAHPETTTEFGHCPMCALNEFVANAYRRATAAWCAPDRLPKNAKVLA